MTNNSVNRSKYSYQKSALIILSITTTFLVLPSCKDKLPIEQRIEVQVTPLQTTNEIELSPSTTSAEMAKEHFRTEFRKIKSEEALKSTIEATNSNKEPKTPSTAKDK
ncbi:MAG: hypothetical protein ACSHX6_15735 [Akkermansiaceae bacterium]